MKLNKFRIFVQDVGTEGYSAAGRSDVFAANASDALEKGRVSGWKCIAVAHQSRHLWPDSKTGKLPGLQIDADFEDIAGV